MSQQFVALRLPFMHTSLADRQPASITGMRLLNLSPGLGDVQEGAFWVSDKYLLAPRDADAILSGIASADVEELKRMRTLGFMDPAADQIRFHDEMASMAQFIDSDGDSYHAKEEITPARRLVLEQAQKNLIWIWRQEETFLEIARLTRQCATTETSLRECFLEPGIKADPALRILPDLSLLPPWRICLVNAMQFVPAAMPIFVEGPMRVDLLEQLDFAPASQIMPACPDGEKLIGAKATLSQVLSGGHAKTATSDISRIWLTWSE